MSQCARFDLSPIGVKHLPCLGRTAPILVVDQNNKMSTSGTISLHFGKCSPLLYRRKLSNKLFSLIYLSYRKLLIIGVAEL